MKLAFVAAVLLCAPAFGNEAQLVLARRGTASSHSIRIQEGASSNVVHAAKELSRYIGLLTGVDVPVANGATARPEIRLAVKPGLGHDAFLFRTEGDNFYIVGDDERAVLFGVYDFLENRCDCDWLAPDQEFVPRLDVVQVPRGFRQMRKPAFALRDCYYADARNDPAFAAKLKLSDRDPFDKVLWKCHTFTTLLPPEKHFKDHPEYYALVKGERKGGERANLCLSNPDVLRIVTSNVLARIAEVYPAVKIFGVSASDSWDWCECKNCAAVDAREESNAGSNVAFVNAVADAVAQRYPDVIIETLAYQQTMKAPKHVRPRDNVMVCLCTDQCDFSRPLTETRFHRWGIRFVDNLRTWCEMTKYIHLWDYTMNFQYKLHAFPNIYSLKPNLETFLDCGVTEVFEQGPLPSRHQAGETLKLYLLGHLMWDPKQPLEILLSRFYRRYYGEAGPWMRRYMEELHGVSRARDETVVPLMMWGAIDSPALPTDFFERGADYMAKAAEAVKDDPVKSRNVRWEMNANDYTRIMRATDLDDDGKLRDGADMAHALALKAAAKRVLADWNAHPDAARISESDSICAEARRKLERYASLP